MSQLNNQYSKAITKLVNVIDYKFDDFEINNFSYNIEKYYNSQLFIAEYYEQINDKSYSNQIKNIFNNINVYYTLDGILFIAEFYNKTKDYNNMIWFYEMAYNYYPYYNSSSIYLLLYYLLKIGDRVKLRYYTKIFYKNNKSINNNDLLFFGSIYELLGDTQNVLYCYLKHNSKKAYYKLANYYYNVRDKRNLKNIILDCIHLRYFNIFNFLDLFVFKSLINIIQKFNTIKNLPNNIINKIKEIENRNNYIQIYKNKLRYSEQFNMKLECIICYDNEYHIDIGCGHLICKICYLKINKCPYNCKIRFVTK